MKNCSVDTHSNYDNNMFKNILQKINDNYNPGLVKFIVRHQVKLTDA